ncbi:hypothetical protein JJL45_05180 [Tamlana sp. s12]|uniref:ArdC-like ssDNA-binding domain-containing protein n=1 Tax=Tamlana sp. s12 TaxID=1630406 RepID=UPI0007FF30C8|nr:ArdC-like ssDNA-binding domain-containing protein [Tamlana sp. s12]OBQ56103.1 hypothetical protein VQ01_06880 [Tamlana sp. s12]QQY83384.1 hypothetical protein JJL45_05180 [Tamlana sp. s12]
MENLHQQIFNCKSRDERKQLLKNLSKSAKQIIEATNEGTVNSVLLDWYKSKEHQEFNSFLGWKKKGFAVKKGSKSFFIWSKPQKASKEKPNNEENEEFEFYGIAYLFSNAQVEPLKN